MEMVIMVMEMMSTSLVLSQEMSTLVEMKSTSLVLSQVMSSLVEMKSTFPVLLLGMSSLSPLALKQRFQLHPLSS